MKTSTSIRPVYSRGLTGAPGLASGYSSRKRRATAGGTSWSTSPPKDAISFTPLEDTKLYCGLAITYIVSISGASRRFRWFIWNSHSKSEITRRPLTIVFAFHRRANSTTSSVNTSTSTFPGSSFSASAVRMKSTRSSTVNIVALCCGSRTTPTTTRSKISAVRRITSRCPYVTGSYAPGQIAVTGSGAIDAFALVQGHAGRAVAAAGADLERRELRLVPGGGLERDEAVLGEDCGEVLGEPHGDGFNHVVGRIDQDQVEAAALRGEERERFAADDLGRVEAQLLQIALDRA